MNENKARNIMIVDDEPELTELIADIAEMEGHQVIQLNDSNQFDVMFERYVDLLFIDLNMPGKDGIEILRYLARIQAEAAIVIISGFDNGVLDVAYQLAKEHDLNIHSTLTKPFRIESIQQILDGLSDDSDSKKLPLKRSKPEQEVISVEMVKEALERGDFCFHYQPQVSLLDDKIVGYEALARWRHPKIGMIPPASFIPFLETHGLISELSLALIRKGFDEFAQFKKNADLTLSINISTDQLTNLDLPDILYDLTKANQLKPQQIIIEVTESGVIQDIRVSLDILARFRLRGFKLSIDDFGTGSAMYEHLQKLPVNELKIDKSFVDKVLTDTKAKLIVSHTASLAQDLNLKTVAEGVETKDVAYFLKYSKIDIGQGYLYSKPLPFEQILHGST